MILIQLVIMTPKSLLRHPEAKSSLDEMSTGCVLCLCMCVCVCTRMYLLQGKQHLIYNTCNRNQFPLANTRQTS